VGAPVDDCSLCIRRVLGQAQRGHLVLEPQLPSRHCFRASSTKKSPGHAEAQPGLLCFYLVMPSSAFPSRRPSIAGTNRMRDVRCLPTEVRGF
jgi:hypothetical protein